jgi:para-aminobenzoate synthetase / 4-amino-4-deoxychorismate lyase
MAAKQTPLTPSQLKDQICLLTDFPGQKAPQLLTQPSKILTTSLPQEIPDLLSQAESMAKAGGWVGGFLSYEAASAFSLPTVKKCQTPLLWFAQFEQSETLCYPHPDRLAKLADCSPQPLISPADYHADLDKILSYILAGDSYQVNHTVSAKIGSAIDLATLYLKIQPQHRFPYGTWLNTGEIEIASFSPELLISKQGNRLTTAPIKGTRPRSDDFRSDQGEGEALIKSQKDRAEHLMIVDMARNDLGRVCSVGSVQVPHLFEKRSFSTVHHLESRVQGQSEPGRGLDSIMEALFPAASITGAPKKRAMEIIQELEGRERGIYTGSIGIIEPGGDCTFNVAIRTVTQNRSQKGAYLGLGGGIVADSNPHKEWAEIAHKGAFLSKIPEPFGLIETFLLPESGVVKNLPEHLNRLGQSARRLGFVFSQKQVESQLNEEINRRLKEGPVPQILRLLLTLDGQLSFSHRPFVPVRKNLSIVVASNRLDRMDLLLQHKTSRRDLFTVPFQAAKAQGRDDVLFLNNIGLVTEGAIRGVMVRLDGQWYVPQISDGLLPSIWRSQQIRRLGAKERSLTLELLIQAEEIRMGNAVHGGGVVVELWLEGEQLLG